MADQITARKLSAPPHPAGAFPAVCVDIVDLGEAVDTYQGKTSVLPKLALVFQTNDEDENGKPREIHIEVSNSFGKKSKLRKLLEGWRGQPYSDEQAREGVPIHKLEGKNGILNIIHKVAVSSGNTYALIDGIMPPIRGQARIDPIGYKRAEFWEKRKADYRAEVAKHNGVKETPAGGTDDFDTYALIDDDDADLPF